MPKKSGTPEDWHRARTLYAEGASYRDIAAALDNRLSTATLNRWAVRETWERGVLPRELVTEETPQIVERADAPPEVFAANTEWLKATLDRKFSERKHELAMMMANAAERLVNEAFEPAVTRVVKVAGGSVQIVDVHTAEPPSGDKKSLITSAAIAIDKAMLLSGEATSRTELLGTASAARERLKFMRDEVAERRNAKAGESSEEESETG